MTNKILGITTACIALAVIFAGYSFVESNRPQSAEDLCKNSQDFQTKVKACGDILRKSDGKYLMLVKAIEDNSRIASGAREEIKKARDEFYKTTLSGLNVDF